MRVMSADWTTCRVVRDCDGELWFRGCDSDDLWTANTNYPDVFLTTDEVLTVFGPLAPVLNADGLPVWQPIEPGTVIKAGTRVRRPYLTDSGAVEHILPTDTPANDGWCIDPRTVPVEPVDPRAELLAEELHKLVADFQANGNSRGLGDPTAGVWFEAAQQVLDALNTALCPTCGADHGGGAA